MSQIDLPKNQQSGLKRTMQILEGIEGIGMVHLSAEDVVRHRLVKEIIKAFDKEQERQQQFRDGDTKN